MPMPQYNGPMYSQGPTAVGPYNLPGYQPTFGYNPQQTYMPQTPQPDPSQGPMAIPHLIGRSISANDQIPPKEIPSDGSPAYFPMQDGSEPECVLRLPAELLSVLRLLSHGKKV